MEVAKRDSKELHMHEDPNRPAGETMSVVDV